MFYLGDQTNPIDVLGKLVDETLTVAYVINGPLHCVASDETAANAAAILNAQDFDVAGVTAGSVANYVERDALQASSAALVHEVATPILASMCVEMSMPLSHLFMKLRERDWVFVLDSGEVGHVVTRADLQAPAIGVVVLAYLTLIETGLRRLVAPRLGDSLLDSLSEERRLAVETLYERKRRHNVAIGYADCLYFTDWLELAHGCGALKPLGLGSRRKVKQLTGSFPDMRNALAHGGTILDQAPSAAKALDRVERIRAFAEALWRIIDPASESWIAQLEVQIQFPRQGDVFAGPEAIDSLPDGGPWYVVTAWNPMGTQRSREENRSANKELRAVARAQRLSAQDCDR